jgi:putative ABC transport system ATP-binding protein
MSLLEIKNGYKIYGNKETKVTALDNVNLSIEQGEFIAILGPSGSGKSTLLNVLGGLDNLSKGDIFLNGASYKSYNDEQMSKFRREKFGFVFQSFQLIPVFTVYENIVTPILLDGKKVDECFIDELLESLGVLDKKHCFPNQLSGGQQQRVAIGRALANKPSIIYADEPTGNLDTVNGEEVIRILMDGVKKYNHTVILVTHNEKIAEYADRIIVVENGMAK